jgi:hypothetical protein
MAAMGGMGVGMGEMGPGVDPGGMGVPPMPMDENEMMMQAMEAVLGKWQGAKAQIAGEQNSLMQILMLIAGAQPPGAEAAVMGSDPSGYGMSPDAMY